MLVVDLDQVHVGQVLDHRRQPPRVVGDLQEPAPLDVGQRGLIGARGLLDLARDLVARRGHDLRQFLAAEHPVDPVGQLAERHLGHRLGLGAHHAALAVAQRVQQRRVVRGVQPHRAVPALRGQPAKHRAAAPAQVEAQAAAHHQVALLLAQPALFLAQQAADRLARHGPALGRERLAGARFVAQPEQRQAVGHHRVGQFAAVGEVGAQAQRQHLVRALDRLRGHQTRPVEPVAQLERHVDRVAVEQHPVGAGQQVDPTVARHALGALAGAAGVVRGVAAVPVAVGRVGHPRHFERRQVGPVVQRLGQPGEVIFVDRGAPRRVGVGVDQQLTQGQFQQFGHDQAAFRGS